MMIPISLVLLAIFVGVCFAAIHHKRMPF
ncbi:MAG TPA: hypothetical protein DCR93_08160 [Cytophagales bacterium]|nr:hypothetical protein [Cytophagales bacterium]HAP59459.1 hypothetical protein [Cytophagales bacterium]